MSRFIPALAVLALCGLVRAEDVNSQLATAYRSDVIGPEVWTATERLKCSRAYPNGATQADYLFHEQPATFFGTPEPGLRGSLHIVHETSFTNAVVPEVTDGGARVTFAAVRNHWTPAGVTTYYRAEPIEGRADDTSYYGALVLKETKCITDDNVFICEAEIKNTLSNERRVKVAFKVADGIPREPKRVRFTTESMCQKIAREAILGFRTTAPEGEFVLKPHEALVFRYALAVHPTDVKSCAALLDDALADANVFAANAESFNAWFAKNVPALQIDNADIKKIYLYRWFVVKRAIHEARRVIGDHEYPRRAVYESPTGGWYDCVIGLPVPMHVQEMSWMRDKGPVQDDLLNWCEQVKCYRWYIQFTGMTVARLLLNHPDKAFAARMFEAIRDDAIERAGTTEKGKLRVQEGSWSTGAEYQPNFYQFTEQYGSPKWDYRHDSEFFKKHPPKATMYRPDTTAFNAANLLGAAKIATLIGRDDEARTLREQGEAMLETMKAKMWDEKLGLFLAADPKTWRLADEAACYDSFVPYMFGMVSEPKYFVAFDKFCDPRWFWDEFPISTCAKTCPMYSTFNAITGPNIATPRAPHKYGCSWNGPTWHYSNALAAEAFGEVAVREPARRAKWIEFFRKWTELHFLFGDRTAPRAGENVQAETGMRCCITPDYFHSSMIDPFIRYYCGISISEDLKTVTFDPFTTEDFTLTGVPLGGREYFFEQKNGIRRYGLCRRHLDR